MFMKNVSSFFVAIPPSKRPEWGRQMNSLVKSGGFLITLVYPIKPFTEDGPPFFIRPEHYVEILEDTGNWEKVIDMIPVESHESHIGLEHLVVWKKL
jgi:methyl halide transferase